MMPELLASFTAPVHIGTNPASMLWMFPLLAAIAIIYKVTKLRVLFYGRFFWETFTLFSTLCAFMLAAIIVLNLVGWLVTS